MTNNIPNSSSENLTNKVAEYTYLATYEGETLSKSISAKNINATLDNGVMSVFQNRSTEGDIDEITMVNKDIENQDIVIEEIDIDNEHNITISIKIADVMFEGHLNHKITPSKKKKNPASHSYEIEFESEKVMIGSIMILPNGKTVEINEGNINDYNKRKLTFTGLSTYNDEGDDYFELSDGDITDFKNQSVEIIKTGGKLSSYILGVITSALLILGAQNYSKETTEFVSEVSDKVSSSLKTNETISHAVKKNENLSIILKNKQIKFSQSQLKKNKSLPKDILLNIKIDINNNLLSIEDAFSGDTYTK